MKINYSVIFVNNLNSFINLSLKRELIYSLIVIFIIDYIKRCNIIIDKLVNKFFWFNKKKLF